MKSGLNFFFLIQILYQLKLVIYKCNVALKLFHLGLTTWPTLSNTDITSRELFGHNCRKEKWISSTLWLNIFMVCAGRSYIPVWCWHVKFHHKLKEKAVKVLYYCCCRQIPRRDLNQQCFCLSLNTFQLPYLVYCTQSQAQKYSFTFNKGPNLFDIYEAL